MRMLRTARLRLRPLKAAELAEVNAANNGPPGSAASAEALRWMERTGPGADPSLGGGWSFRYAVSGRLIGLCLYFCPDAALGAAEISYIVSPAYRRRGYCTEAMAAVVADLFAHVGFRRLYADVATDNTASLRVLAKLAFDGGEAASEPVAVGLDRRPAVRRHLHAERRPAVAPSGGSAPTDRLTSP